MMNAAIGGVLVGIGGGILWAGIGRIAGISGILRGALLGDRAAWRFAFLAGVCLASAMAAVRGPAMALTSDISGGGILLAGVVGGVGVKLANGCTSGHGVCGLGRFSVRSLTAATLFCVLGVTASLAVRGAF